MVGPDKMGGKENKGRRENLKLNYLYGYKLLVIFRICDIGIKSPQFYFNMKYHLPCKKRYNSF